MNNQLLVSALKNLEKLQKNGSVFQGKDFSEDDLKVLKKTGFLKGIIRGWYHASKPNENESDTTSWYMSYSEFIAKYLKSRFKKAYCLNSESSIVFHTGITSLPKQIVVMVKKPINDVVSLPHGTSILIYDAGKNFPKQNELDAQNGIITYTLETALCNAKPLFFKNSVEEAQIALNMLKDVSPVITILLNEKMKPSASRLTGALTFIGRESDAARIQSAWKNATLENLIATNPFEQESPILTFSREKNPHALRIRSKWKKWREVVANIPHIQPKFIESSLLEKSIEEKYTEDAYHSLSIEGYKVTRELIDKVALGNWNPDNNDEDKDFRNALAAKGYFNAFEVVVKNIIHAINNQINCVEMIKKEHHEWHSQLFSASVLAGIIESHHLAGYRNSPIYLRNSIHVPLPAEALVDAMEAYFDCMKEESDPFVQAVLGHRLFGYIHPYFDGNGRMARFIMNAVLTSNGYPWLIIKVEERAAYLQSLEMASGENDDIELFAKFIANGLKEQE